MQKRNIWLCRPIWPMFWSMLSCLSTTFMFQTSSQRREEIGTLVKSLCSATRIKRKARGSWNRKVTWLFVVYGPEFVEPCWSSCSLLCKRVALRSLPGVSSPPKLAMSLVYTTPVGPFLITGSFLSSNIVPCIDPSCAVNGVGCKGKLSFSSATFRTLISRLM